jgi:hypothetical protein
MKTGRAADSTLIPTVRGPSNGVHFTLLDYLARGDQNSLVPSPFFSDNEYLLSLGQDRLLGMPDLLHYLKLGAPEGARPHPEFDPPLFATLAGLGERTEPYSHFVEALLQSKPAPPAANGSKPIASIIVLNHRKTVTTLQCLYFLTRHTDLERVEIVVVDNGSDPDDFELLARHAGAARVIRLEVNRGFDEGNNTERSTREAITSYF